MLKFLKKLLLKKLLNHLKEYDDKNLYSLCMSSYFKNNFPKIDNYKEANDLLNLCIKCDKKIPISKEAGKEIEELFYRDDIVVGVYRTFFDEMTLKSVKIRNILTKGIHVTNNPYIMPNLSRKIMITNNILDIMQLLKGYDRNNKIDIILTFPKQLLEETKNYNMKSFYTLYSLENDGIYISPEYIHSYIIVNQGIMKKINKDGIKKTLTNNKKPTD